MYYCVRLLNMCLHFISVQVSQVHGMKTVMT